MADDPASVQEIHDIVDVARQTCRTVLLRAPSDYPDLEALDKINAYAVGPRWDRHRPPDYSGHFELFAEQTESPGLRS